VVFWGKPGEKDLKQWSFPDNGFAHATPQQAESVRNKFQDVQAFGATDVSAAIKLAYSLKPEVIFLVTAKGIDLDDSFGRGADSSRKNSNAKVTRSTSPTAKGRSSSSPSLISRMGFYTPLSPFDIKPD